MTALRLTVLFAILLCCWPTGTVAEGLGSIRLPDSTAPLPDDKAKTLLDPPTLTDAWSAPGHRPLGVTLSNYNLTEQQIEAARQTGCGMVRLIIPMEHFLDDADSDWATLDQVISRLKRADLQILAVLDADIPVRDFYRDFAERVALRYRESLSAYQILDNVNYKIGLTTQNYADLLSVTRPSIRLADADALIVSGGIRGCDLTYLEMLENQRGLHSLDVIALSLYPPADGIEHVTPRMRSEHSLPYAEQIVNWARQRGKRVWVSTFGASTDASWVGLDQVTQASVYARGALILGLVGVERIFLASIQDTDPSYSIPVQCCGLLDINGQPKASFYALQSLNQAVQGAYHAAIPFACSGQTFMQPSEGDIIGLRERHTEYSRKAFEQGGMENLAQSGPLDPFKVHNLEVYSFWFYQPQVDEYRLVYWRAGPQAFNTLISVFCMAPGLEPLKSHLTPLESYQLLDAAPSEPTVIDSRNMILMLYQPLDSLPGLIRFKASDPRPAPVAQLNPPIMQP